jgi:hypothetical protein
LSDHIERLKRFDSKPPGEDMTGSASARPRASGDLALDSRFRGKERGKIHACANTATC